MGLGHMQCIWSQPVDDYPYPLLPPIACNDARDTFESSVYDAHPHAYLELLNMAGGYNGVFVFSIADDAEAFHLTVGHDKRLHASVSSDGNFLVIKMKIG